MTPQKIKRLRAAIVAKYGARNYRITRGQVHIYGPKPSSQIVGWWQMGDIDLAMWWMGVKE